MDSAQKFKRYKLVVSRTVLVADTRVKRVRLRERLDPAPRPARLPRTAR